MSSIDTPAGSSTRSEPAPAGSTASPTAAVSPSKRSAPPLGRIVLALVGLALVLRLWELGERPLHHDESLDAWWSWLFRNGNYEGYDPVYHGPLRFYITAGFFELFGESEASARLFSALSGTAVVGLPWFLRHELGRAGTIAAAAALCISPTMLYYSRFGREDAQMVFLALLALVLGLAYLRRPRTLTAAALAFVLACSFAIKESTYLFGLLLAVYVLVVVAAQFDARNKVSLGHGDDAERLDPAFFAAAMGLAAVGLIAAVVVGSASDELFPMLALYGAGLVAFVAVTALPAIRAAELRWAGARAACWLAIAAVLASLVLTLRGGPASYDVSLPMLVLAAVLAVAAVAVLVVPAARALANTGTWAAALVIAAGGLVLRQWLGVRLEDQLGADPIPPPWSVSGPMVVVGVLLVALGASAIWGERLGELAGSGVSLPSEATRGLVGTAATLAGGGLLLNEYLEVERSRSIAFVAVVVTIAGLVALVGLRPRCARDDFEWPPLLRAFGAIGWRGWAVTLATFAVAWFLFFSVWGSVKQDWASGFTRAIDYWDSQQEVNRGGQPWYYYFYALPAYEWLFVLLAFVGGWRAMRRPTVLSGLFVWFSIGSLVLYSYAGERMPWLIAHPLLPILVLSGMGVQQLWQHRTHRFVPGLASVLAVGLLLTALTSIRASFPNGSDSREILSQAGQATPHLTAALERLENIDRISRLEDGEGATLAIGTANAWPYNWYLRDRPSVLWFSNETGPPTDGSADVIIVDFATVDPVEMPDYQATLFAMRSWWVPTYTEAGPSDWLAWARGRELWPQGPNPSFAGVSESVDASAEGLAERAERIRDGIDDTSSGWLAFAARDGERTTTTDRLDEFDDGRDGCGSVDQWFLVRNELATVEAQVYPEPIAEMGPLPCASDLLASG